MHATLGSTDPTAKASPAVGGRQYRVRDDAQVRLRSGLEAPMKLRPLARHRPPNSSLPDLDAIFIIPSAAKRHKRLRYNRAGGVG